MTCKSPFYSCGIGEFFKHFLLLFECSRTIVLKYKITAIARSILHNESSWRHVNAFSPSSIRVGRNHDIVNFLVVRNYVNSPIQSHPDDISSYAFAHFDFAEYGHNLCQFFQTFLC